MSKTKDSQAFEYGVSTHTGLVRLENQDCYAEFESINGHVFIVCDGMGGAAGGAVASEFAVNSIRAYLENHYFDVPEDALKAAIEFANAVVYKKSRENKEYQGMGTTIVLAVIRHDKVHYAHVGDSRIYIFSDERLQRLTRDHSRIQHLIDNGVLTEQEGRTHPDRNIITRVLGTGPNIEIEFCSSPAIPALNDIMMICTDGLFNMLEDHDIAQILSSTLTIQEKADRLVQRANEKDGTDNSTVQLIYFNNVTNKKSKFVALYQIPKELRPIKKDEEQPLAEPEITNEPVDTEPDVDFEQPASEPLNYDEPVVTEPEYNKEPEAMEPIADDVQQTARDTENVVDTVVGGLNNEQEPQYIEPKPHTDTVQDQEKNSFLDRFGFYRKLKEKPGLKKKINMIAVIALVVFIAFVFWDLFIKQSGTTRINDTNTAVTVDTLKTVEKNKNAAVVENEVPPKTDTIWISYSVKKGEFLGTIASKFGVKIEFIKKKNKLANDNIREKQKLDIPTKANHLVKSGENIDVIAKKYQVDKKRILKVNDMTEEKSIKADKSLIIPFK
ncbi:MAG TPA: Stp1/IreP family PP2C-type Ser/Thr phosphatase [Bacteroidales bacterium]|nr:Stp1/IreP family PP2C-type Ser/Thr phosphatase [Bacteroidales bacterium]